MINYSGGSFSTAVKNAQATNQDILIKSGVYGRVSFSGVEKDQRIWYENGVVFDGGLHGLIQDIRNGDTAHDIEDEKKRALFQVEHSTGRVFIAPASEGDTITYRNAGRGVAGWQTTGGIRHEGGLFHNLLGRAFGGTADNMALVGAKVWDVVLENYNHRRYRKFQTGGGWAAAVASWGSPAKNWLVEGCQFLGGIWGEAVGLFDVTGFTVTNNLLYNPSHTVGIYGSSAGNVAVTGNTIIIDENCPRRVDGRLPHAIAIGKEGNDNYNAIHKWHIENNTIWGGTSGVHIGWVEHPFVFDVSILNNTIMGQAENSIRSTQHNGLMSGKGIAQNNRLDRAPRLDNGQWANSGNVILGTTQTPCTPDSKRLHFWTEDGQIKYELEGG